MKTLKTLTLAILLLSCATAYSQKYKPAPENLRNRKEFANERFGIFLHWGIYSTFAQGSGTSTAANFTRMNMPKRLRPFIPTFSMLRTG